jgi:hypothetical protein
MTLIILDRNSPVSFHKAMTVAGLGKSTHARTAAQYHCSARLSVMRTLTRFSLALTTALILAAGCAHSPNMSQADVIRLANRAAEDAGYKLAGYKAPETHYEFVRKDKTWTVFFVMKPPTPAGGHFQVWVDDRTGKTEVMRGE